MTPSDFKLAMNNYLNSITEIESCKFMIYGKDIEIIELNGAAIRLNKNILYRLETQEIYANNQLQTNLMNANFKISQCNQLIKDIIMLYWSLDKEYMHLSDQEQNTLLLTEGISNFSYKRGYNG